MYNKNELHIITIDDIGIDGEGIGKLGGFTFFVENALPGETVEMRIVKMNTSYGYGKLTKLISPSPERIMPECPHFNVCGGCTLQHLSYPAQLCHKTNVVKNCLERIGGFRDIEISGAIGMETPWRFRNKAQFPVGYIEGSAVAGFYARRSHRLVNIPDCMIIHPLNRKILQTVNEFADRHKISVYDENTNRGLLRHVMTRTSSLNNETMVCIVINGTVLPHSAELVESLLRAAPEISSIQLNINTQRTNVILGKECRPLWGKPYIVDAYGDLKFKISPLSFFQTNHVQTEVLYSRVLSFGNFQPTDLVIDAYCGIGTISLLAARRAGRVIGVEIVPQAIDNAIENAAANDIHNADFICGSAETVLPKLINDGLRPDVIILDPPRKGCERPLLDAITASRAPRLIYVSCDPATLARDLRILAEGGFRLDAAQPVDMFPWSGHVECAAMLTRDA